MTEESETQQPVEPLGETASKRCMSPVHLSFWLTLMLLLAVGLGIVMGPTLPNFLGDVPPAPGSVRMQERIDALESRIAALESKPTIASEPQTNVQLSSAPTTGADDLAKLRENLSGFSAALETLQKELLASSEKTDNVRVHAETGLATVLAFVRMQMAYMSGQPFEHELLMLRRVVGEGAPAAEDMAKLDAYAASGVPTIQTLQKEWHNLAADAQAAIRKSAAQTWQDRLVVAIENLVSIRHLNDLATEPMVYRNIDKDLSDDNLSAALQKVDALPAEVKEVVKNWRARAESRQQAGALISGIAERLVQSPEPAPDATTPMPPEASETQKVNP